ncbi:uncharacterized protein JN550_000392 [Neoarthrinium moseri]|uniref:uncharacterized protein n=1 Tax=Neoarthrinium moseri TaxID=1658444 RepID=UPI001FDB2DF4|nr:uncharacterized protein JN550_000392 [Neoarthrinium moseri]KAI1878210.1 hypothetical protein JN550_000392 [Neoarthrinium moseri]
MSEYSRDEVSHCLGGRRVVFAGDSTVRQIYWAAATRLDHEKAHVALLDVLVDNTKHENLHFEAEGVQLEFIWDPWLNTSHLETELRRFRIQESVADIGTVRTKSEESAALVVLGSPGLWAARHGEDDYFDIFKRGIDNVRAHLQSRVDSTLVSPTANLTRNYDLAPNQIFLAPIQTPWYESLSKDRAATMTREKINKMNNYLEMLSWDEQSHVLWAYSRMTLDGRDAFEDTGIHVVEGVGERKIDILLNARCNSGVGHEYPHKQTCCMRYPQRNSLQFMLFLSLPFVGPSMLRWTNGRTRLVFLQGMLPSNDVLSAARFLAVVFALCWGLDRSHLIQKVERHYEEGSFLAVCAVFLLVSLLSRRNSANAGLGDCAQVTTRPIGRFTTDHDQRFLPREQCDEWKGWMQALILMYHYNYASQTLWVYKVVRLLVSAYIFLSAYGHTLYLLKTEDFSLRRVAVVIFRLNLLSAVLPYVMMTDYNFYYFAPVVSFYYLVTWSTLRVYRSLNQSPLLLLVKIMVAAIITSCIILIPQPVAGVSTLCRVVFRMSWDSSEARFRLGLERLIGFFGMATASLVHRTATIRTRRTFDFATASLSQSHQESAVDPLLYVLAFPDSLGNPLKMVTSTVAAAFIFFYIIVTQATLNDKVQYNIGHPYMSWIPILSFAILRNSHHKLRKTYLGLPAALGRISLETYVFQYHMWLGSDATSRLRIGLWDRFGSSATWALPLRVLETVLLTAVFICVSAQTRNATETLTQWLAGTKRTTGRCRAVESSAEMNDKSTRPDDEGSDNRDGHQRPNSARSSSQNTTEATAHQQGDAGHSDTKGVRRKILVIVLVLWLGNLLYR